MIHLSKKFVSRIHTCLYHHWNHNSTLGRRQFPLSLVQYLNEIFGFSFCNTLQTFQSETTNYLLKSVLLVFGLFWTMLRITFFVPSSCTTSEPVSLFCLCSYHFPHSTNVIFKTSLFKGNITPVTGVHTVSLFQLSLQNP